jgi:uncharacterized SAM-binding protein YcdF (DUF218 family)
MNRKQENDQSRKKQQNHRIVLLLFLLGICCLGLTVSPLLLRGLGGYLIVSDAPVQVNSLVILSGDNSRLDSAVKLYKENYAQRIILTETDLRSDNPEASDTRSTMEKRKELINLGVAEEDILVTRGQSSSTYDEAIAVKILLESKWLTSIIVITDPYHSRRTKITFNDVFSGSGIEVLVTCAQGHWYQSGTWWLSLNGWRVTMIEYTKLIAYWSGYKNP